MQSPLEGIRVLDFGHYVFGPTAGKNLAQLGADVIKVEPLEGDLARISESGIDSTTFLSCNVGKRSIALNLREPKGLEIAHKLVSESDVIRSFEVARLKFTREVQGLPESDFTDERVLEQMRWELINHLEDHRI